MENQLSIQVSPEVADGVYSNLAIISHASSEFVLDFVRILPNVQQAQVKSRIILTPEHAMRLYHALQDNLNKYQARFGEIKMPKDNGNIPMSFNGGEA